MATKFEYYSSLAEETSGKLTKSVDQWTAFLRTAGRMSKYSYAEQLMIFAQRPDATACAEYELWNSTMRRYVKRGAKGIALIDTRWDRPRLRYVFDVSDTGERKNSRTLNRWEMRDEYVRPVQEALEAVFDVSSASPFDVQIENIARWTADDYYQEHEYELDDIVAESYLEEYDDDNRRLSFINAAAVSIKYEILSRCTEEPDEYFDPDEFTAVFDYNTRKSINALGTAVSEISSQIFREIEATIRSYERSRRTERSHDYGTELYAERGLSDSQHQTERDRERAAGQIRQDAQDVPERTSPNPLQRPDTDGAAVPASEGDRRDRTSQSGAADGRATGEEPGTGQSDAADGMGTAHEQPESAGGGTGADRAGVQLTSNPFEDENSGGRYEQMSFFFPTEAEQIEAIDRAAESEKPSAFSLAQTDIDHFLRLGGRSDKSRMIIAAEYMEGKSTEKIVDTLREEYRGGMGILTDNGRMSAWFGEEGIILARGDHARFAAQHQFLAWEDAADRIGELLDAGEFATNVELAETAGNSRSDLATSIWHLRHDFSDMTKGVPLLTTLDEYRGGGFPDEIEKLSAALTDPDTLGAVTRDMLVFSAAYKNNPGILRFHYHDVPKILEQLQDLAAPWKEYTSEMTEVPKAGQFITEDEIDYALTYGSSVHGGKGRIYSFFSNAHQQKEAVSFLKDEYGIGGHSDGCINKFMSYENHDGKGIQLSKPGCSDVTISWNITAKRIDKLIQTDRYLTDEEKRQMEQIREAHEEETDAEMQEPKREQPLETEAQEPELEQSPETEVQEQEREQLEDRFHVVDVDTESSSQRMYAVWDDQSGGYHEDSDGLVSYFDSHWQAEEYREELIESAKALASRSSLDKAKDLINTYCVEEFGSEADFTDMTPVSVSATRRLQTGICRLK